nr:poly [ADP-ribose] polymerase 12 isoform X1 [Onthophagus taurus]XP_022920466.1 poly [ADP-ribose] polymerase 12 isoform X1 [Onthophagus taurus]
MPNFDFIRSGPVQIKSNKSNDQLLVKVLQQPEAKYWVPRSYKNDDYHLEVVQKNSDEYEEIEELFYGKNYKAKLKSVRRVQNPYLLGQYLIKKEEIKREYGTVNVHKLFHGTKRRAIDDIIRDGFDWRLHGENRGVRYGNGVNFTTVPGFARHFGSQHPVKYMILCDVLIAKACLGSEGLELPPKGYDTTIKSDWKVVVKFDDYEHYPSYILKYITY